MKLELVDYSQNALNNIVRAGRNCYQSKSKGYEEDVKLVKALITVGHESPLEFGWAMFHVNGISRACADQLRTHRLLSFTMMSQRYVDISEQEFIHPFKALEIAGESVKAMEQSQKDFYKLLVKNGVPKEDARMYIGIGVSTEVYFACNFRELRHILKLRIDKHAQTEIRTLARGIYDICSERWPWILEGVEL